MNSRRVSHPVGGVDPVQQNFAQGSSVGDLVERHRLGAAISDPSATRQPIFGDFTSLDFQRYQDTVIDVKRNFDKLPSKVRRKFNNDPYQLLRFVDDPANLAEAKELGIIVDRPEPVKTVGNSTLEELAGALRPDPEANPHKKEV